MKKQLQQGFTVIEGLLILVIAAIVGFTGWYVYHARNNVNSTLSSAANTSVAVKGATKKAAAKSTPATTTTPKASGCAYSLSLANQNGTAGTTYEDLVFTNTSDQSCTLNGYPKVVLTDANGTQTGQAATNDTSTSPADVTVAAGAMAHVTLNFPDSSIPGSGCDAAVSSYIDATLPGSTTVLKVAATQQWCTDFRVTPLQSGN